MTKPDGTAYRVYTPFYKAWLAHGWPEPAAPPDPGPEWLRSRATLAGSAGFGLQQ